MMNRKVMLLERLAAMLNGFENIVENGGFAQYEQMPHFSTMLSIGIS